MKTIIAPALLVAAALTVVARASLAQASAGSPPAEGAGVQTLLSRVDAKWQDRLWRLARRYFWLSDNPKLSSDEKSRLGKKSWEYGDRATAANPKGVEGWYFAAVGMGNYSLGIGILKALGEGIEGKFRERLAKAESIDPNFYAGGIYNAWGRFYYKLPWPKYDARKSEQNLQKAIKVNPANVRGRIFLAELYEKEGHPKEARKLLEEAAAHQPGSYDIPEERRSQKQARELLAEMKR